MALAYQGRAMLRGLAKLGEPSLLAGSDCGSVAIQRNVDLFASIGDTADDNPVVRYTMAVIDNSYSPKVGQLLAHPDGSFVLDRLHEDNGFISKFIVVGA
jgi:hypothetical protein